MQGGQYCKADSIARRTVLGDARQTALQYGRSTCNTILQMLQYTLQRPCDRESCNTGHTVITILYCNKTTRKVRRADKFKLLV